MIRERCNTKDRPEINADTIGVIVHHGFFALQSDGKNQQLATPRVVSTVYTTTALNTEHVLGATNYTGSVKTYTRPEIQLAISFLITDETTSKNGTLSVDFLSISNFQLHILFCRTTCDEFRT
jgi:hypothetical protein